MNSQDAILGMLMKRSLSGYEIKQFYENIFAYFYSSSYGTIYPMLHRMEKEGSITKEVVLQEGKPNKNVFTITEKGRDQFRSYLSSPVESDSVKSDFLMRLYFGGYAGDDFVKTWLKQSEEHTQKQLDQLNEMYSLNKDQMHPAQVICIEMGIKGFGAKLEAIREGLARMEQFE